MFRVESGRDELPVPLCVRCWHGAAVIQTLWYIDLFVLGGCQA